MKVFCSHTDMVLTDIVKGNPKNPNRHPEKQIELLAKVIDKQGWRAPITISKRSGLVVKGHGRLEAARMLGCDEVPVDYQDYETEAAEIADMLADNKISELSEIDVEIESFHKQELIEADFDLELAGFEPYESYDSYDSGGGDCDPPVIDGLSNLNGSNYSDIRSKRYSVNLFGIGGFVMRELGDEIKEELIRIGLIEGSDNTDYMEGIFNEILHQLRKR